VACSFVVVSLSLKMQNILGVIILLNIPPAGKKKEKKRKKKEKKRKRKEKEKEKE